MRDRPIPEVVYTHLGIRTAYTDGQRTIWIDHRLTRIEERCGLTHELQHIENGDTCHSEAGERRARRNTALLLLPELPTADPDESAYDVAEAHDVTLAVLADRMRVEKGEL